jgi:hypothetical protein
MMGMVTVFDATEPTPIVGEGGFEFGLYLFSTEGFGEILHVPKELEGGIVGSGKVVSISVGESLSLFRWGFGCGCGCGGLGGDG